MTSNEIYTIENIIIFNEAYFKETNQTSNEDDKEKTDKAIIELFFNDCE